ncbi:hypothetical protein EU545_04015 [Candidatus Thorarchaeota archaeon]|nr:MAG: hypothetical protein EU545_04015 [Candidatus Thorarchaeota archaeon]
MAELIPVRVCERGPIDKDYFYSQLTHREEEELRSILSEFSVARNPVFTLIDFWIDGRNTALRIAENVYAETGYRLHEVVLKLLRFLEEHGLIEFRKSE